jgi:hypothetical protein
MAFSWTISDRISFGNKKAVFVNLTNVQDDSSSTIKIGDTVWGVKASNNTDTTDTFAETLGAKSASSTRNQVTFDAGTNDDDGLAFIVYN